MSEGEVGDLSEVSGSYQGAGHQGRQQALEGGIPAELRDTRSREVPHQERNIPSKATDSYPFNGMDVLEKKEFLSSKRSLLYVAITRARQLVYMVGYGEPCGLLENINKTI